MNRRNFLTTLTVSAGAVFVPKFGQWFRRGSGILVRPEPMFVGLPDVYISEYAVIPNRVIAYYWRGTSLAWHTEHRSPPHGEPRRSPQCQPLHRRTPHQRPTPLARF